MNTINNTVNPALICDYYELTMCNGYFNNNMKDKIAYFDVFYRSVPDDGGFAISAGLEQVTEYIGNLHFSTEDLVFLRSKKAFSEDFLQYLKDFRFTGDIFAVPEGTPIFPNEPFMTVRAPIIEAQIIETYLLLTLNHQSLIATKANRIVRAADGRIVSEFGSRRAQGADGAVYGARAAYIAGVNSSSCTASDKLFGVPATGTMAHSWVQMFDDELSAFKTYCRNYPDSVTLLVDTYNVLKSGIPNAIKAFDDVLKPLGKRPVAIRLDSGDITYLSKKAREMLDEAGYSDCKIVASNSLDEIIIRDMLIQGAKVDIFGVGERLITSKSSPVFGGVYKLVALENEDGSIIPKIKISDNVSKVTTPHFKKLYRIYDKKNNKATADLLCVYDETINDAESIELFDPDYVWKRKNINDYYVKELLVPVFKNGELVYNLPSTDEIRDYCNKQIDTLWEEVKRFENPHRYYVDLSQKLWSIKQNLLKNSFK